MNNKTISFNLSENSIDKAIKELENYEAEFLQKWYNFCIRVTNEIKDLAQIGFDHSVLHESTNSTRSPQVFVGISDEGNIKVIRAEGEDAVWVEFGSGVYYNGAAGSSPNPWGQEIGFTIGSYGKGKGKNQAWGYYPANDKSNKAVITHGNPAFMPMYKAALEVSTQIYTIAREEFA